MLNSKRTVVLAAVLLLICFTTLPSAMAQTDRGTITGTVNDPTGAVIVGAKVTATNTATRVGTETATTTSGNYTIPALRAGTYDVSVEQAGFKRSVLTGIVVQVGQTARVDASLQLGETSQAVEVTAETIQIQTETSDRGTVISGREVLDLPIVGQGEQRNPAFFIILSPGVTSRGTSTPTASGSGRRLNTTVNGSPSASLEFHLDGVQIGNPGIAGSAEFGNLPFPQDAVAEFKIMTNSPPAEFGRAGLGITAFNLRSGTNQLHGSVYEYFRNEKLDARGFYAPKTPLNKQNEFGATAGGPILKDKTFFYGWYQGFRLRKEASANSLDTVPTAAMRGGNLSNVLGQQIGADVLGRPVYASQIFDPGTTRTVAAGAVDPGTGLRNTSANSAIIRDGFGFNNVTGLPISGQANIIPSNRIDPVAKAMFAQFPDPVLPGRDFGYTNNWLSAFKSEQDINQWGSKIDHALSANQKIMGEFLWWRNSADTGSKWPGAISEGAISRNGQYIARFSHDSIFRPNLINHWVVGYNRLRTDTLPEGGLDWPSKLGFKGVPQTGAGSVFPQLIIGGLGNVYARGGQGYSASNVYSFDDGLTWIKGKHTFKTGFSYIKFQDNGGSFGGQSSKLEFNAGITGLPGAFYLDGCQPGAACTGMGAASFLLGGVSTASASVYAGVGGERIGQYAAYIQDDFKVTPKLTLNLGLRYDLMLPTVNAHNQRSWVDPFAINPDIGIRGAVVFATPDRRAPVKAFTRAFGPRFGLAYSIDEKTVFRGGYGIMYTAGGFQRSAGTQFLQGYNSNNAIPADLSTGSVGVNPVFRLQDGWPASRFQAPPFISPSYGLGTGPLGAFGDGRLPDIQNWHVSIQRELPGKMLIDVGYVGTKGTHLPSRLMPTTAVDTKYLPLGQLLFTGIADPAVQGLSVVQAMPVDPATGNRSPFKGFQTLWGGGATLGQALRPFPQYGKDTPNGSLAQLRDFGETSGLSTYHALQVQARKQVSQGLSFLVSYTWSKTLSDSESIFNEFSGFTQDFYNKRAEKSLSLLDFPHNLTLSYQYELPFGQGKKFANSGGAVNKVIGGWMLAGIHQYTSGAPQMVTAATTLDPYFGANNFSTRPNVVSGVNKRSQAYLNGTWDPNAPGEAGSLFNIKAFQDPAPFTFGNAPRTNGDMRQLPFLSEDVSIIKRTNITERVNMEFRADFLNIFNRTVFGFDQGGDQYGSIIGGGLANSFGTGSFGHVSGQSNFPREIQFGLKINY